MPASPLPSEVRITTRIVMDETAVDLGCVLNCDREEVILKGRQVKVHIPVKMLGQKKGCCFHREGEVFNCRLKCGKVLSRPSVLPLLTIFTYKGISEWI